MLTAGDANWDMLDSAYPARPSHPHAPPTPHTLTHPLTHNLTHTRAHGTHTTHSSAHPARTTDHHPAMNLRALLFALTLSGVAAAPTPSDYEITSLPGLNASLSFKQYSGYMPINDGHGTEIFFWFVESQTAPSTDPVTLWMNGGPGSSSIAYGFWTEHGPFRLEMDEATKQAHPVMYDHSWNQHANVR